MVHQVPTFCFTAENVGGAVGEIHRLTVNDVIDAVLQQNVKRPVG